MVWYTTLLKYNVLHALNNFVTHVDSGQTHPLLSKKHQYCAATIT